MLGSDDVLACFIAGNTFTWDDWFRAETEDDSFQPTIDMLLNVAIFVWYGAVCPWNSFLHNSVIPIYRLIFLGILVLLFRRIPMIFLMRSQIHQISDLKQTLFVGYFGPIGVSAIFYLYTTREYLRQITVNGTERGDAARLAELTNVVVWFMVICSIVGHGLSIPLGKLGFYIPRTISRASTMSRSTERGGPSGSTIFNRARSWGRASSGRGTEGAGGGPDSSAPFEIRDPPPLDEKTVEEGKSSFAPADTMNGGERNQLAENGPAPRKMWKIGGTIMHDADGQEEMEKEPDGARATRVTSSEASQSARHWTIPLSAANDASSGPTSPTARTIKFGDEAIVAKAAED